MEGKWKIIYYQNAKGKFPASDFIQGLDAKAKSKIINTLDLLKEFGIKLGLPHSRKLTGTQLWELRILGSNNIRIFYVAVIDKTFLLHGFQKKKQKTERKEIKTAQERLMDYNIRKS